jgi:hypothetical protein
MRSMLSGPAYALLALVLPADVALQDPSPARPEPRPGVVWLDGLVTDRQTGAPVPGADVVLAGLPGGRRITDDEGAFRYDSLPPGTHRLSVSGLGYQPVEDSVVLAAGSAYRLSVGLVPQALALDPIVVVAQARPTLLDRVGFVERRQSGLGTFLTREMIEARSPPLVYDLLRAVPGVRIVPGRRGAMIPTMRGGCVPAVFVDGVSALVQVGVDLSLSPDHIEAVEVYRGPETPPQYQLNACGAILFWTREPTAKAGERPFWRRLGVVAAIATVIILLVR